MTDHNLKKHIPILLLHTRLVFAGIILFAAFCQCENARILVLILIYAGIISDVFDGIIARKLNVSNPKFRLLDTIFDLIFYLSAFFFIYIVNPAPIHENFPFIIAILVLEIIMYFISFVRFQRLPSPHAILSKFWGICLVIEFSLLILDVAGLHFTIVLTFGLIAHVDRGLIYLLLPKWDHDIPSSYHANLLRKGKEIRRRTMFNG